MTKIEAAAYLGVSYRAIERYTSSGKLSVSYEPGPRGGSRAMYRQAELDQLKETLNRHHKDKKVINLPTRSPHHDTNNAIQTGHQHADLAAIVGMVVTQLLPAIRPAAKQDDLYLLSIVEAATATGLPEEFLMAATKRKKKPLKVIEIGKDDWRIRRKDLKKWIDNL